MPSAGVGSPDAVPHHVARTVFDLAWLLQIRGGNALLGARCEQAGLLDDPLRGIVEAVSVAVRAGDDPGGHDRLAALAHLEVLRGLDDFLGASGTVFKVVGWFHGGSVFAFVI